MEASNGHHEVTPVLAASEARVIEPAQQQAAVPAPVVAAVGGAVAGAMAFVLLRVLRGAVRRRGQVRLGRRFGRRGIEITGSRSFLVDVHMLKR
jgi:hypothetical protein